MKLLSLTFAFLMVPASALCTPVAIINGSIDFSSMVTSFIFEGTPQIEISNNVIAGGVTLNEQGAGGYGEGQYYLTKPGSQIFASVSEESGFSFFASVTTPGTFSFGFLFNRTFEVTNLKEFSIEYDWNAFVYLSTDTEDQRINIFTEHNGFVEWGSESGYYLSTNADGTVEGDQEFFEHFYHRVQYQYTFDTPYSGIIEFAGAVENFSIISDYSSVPENATASLILPGLICLFAFSFIRRKKSELNTL